LVEWRPEREYDTGDGSTAAAIVAGGTPIDQEGRGREKKGGLTLWTLESWQTGNLNRTWDGEAGPGTEFVPWLLFLSNLCQLVE